MTSKNKLNHEINGWKWAESYSAKAFLLQIENSKLNKKIDELENIIQELKAENQRLSQIAQY